MVDRCEDAVTPALARVEGRVRLSTGEREVALMAAAGYANKEIAQRLNLSTRTVETYLQRVYHKLGVSSRRQVGAALAPHGPELS